MMIVSLPLRGAVPLACLCAVLFTGALSASHPRLLFDQSDVSYLRSRVAHEPYASILDAIEASATNPARGAGYGDVNDTLSYAALYMYGSDDPGTAGVDEREEWAEEAAYHALELIASDPSGPYADMWRNSGHMSLQRSFWGVQVAFAYDYCFDSTFWSTQTIPASFVSPRGNGLVTVPAQYVGKTFNDAVSEALLECADLLVASGGAFYPPNSPGSNWVAVRYGGALVCYFATDEDLTGNSGPGTAEFFTRDFMRAIYSNDDDGLGWNPEGMGYAAFGGIFAYLGATVHERLDGSYDWVGNYPLRHAAWTLAVPGVAQTYLADGLTFRGLRADTSDDHNRYAFDSEGMWQMALAYAFKEDPVGVFDPFDYRPGVMYLFNRFFGDTDQGTGSWAVGRGMGHLTMLYWPDPQAAEPLTEENPEESWGLTYYDPSYGATIFRNRYGTTTEELVNDSVFTLVGNTRENFGSHWASDGGSPKLYSLGIPWLVGSGRTSNPGGQTVVGPQPLQNLSYSEGSGKSISGLFQREAGDGWVEYTAVEAENSTNNWIRRVALDYSKQSGAEVVMVMQDTSDDGDYWRLNTPDFNNISISGNTFTITSPEGSQMIGTVIQPAGATLTTGTFTRGDNLSWKTTSTNQNKYVQMTDPSNEFLVVLAVVENGASAPAVSGTYNNPDDWTVNIPGRTFSFDGTEIEATGWLRPDITLVSPADGVNFTQGTSTIYVSGTATDSDGDIAEMEVFLDDVSLGAPSYDPVTEKFFMEIPGVGIGPHRLRIFAEDNNKDSREVEHTFRIDYEIDDTLDPVDIIVDELDPTVEVVGIPGTRNHNNTWLGQEYSSTAAGTDYWSVSYYFDIPASSTYLVSHWYWTTLARAETAHHYIEHRGGETLVLLDQDEQDSTNAWDPVGTFEWLAGDTARVTITSEDPNGILSCDAIRLQRVDPDNFAPQADAQVTSGTLTGVAPLSLSLDGSGSFDSDGSVSSHDWDFGDGTSDGGPTTSVTYTTPGAYILSLTVTDNEGATATESVLVEVQAADPTTFPGWAALEGLPSGQDNPGDDLEPDGWSHLFEWAFGTDADAHDDPALFPQTTFNGSELCLRFRRDASLQGLTYIVEATDDISDWSGADILYDSSVDLQPNNDGDYMKICEPLNPGEPRRFLRLRLEYTPPAS